MSNYDARIEIGEPTLLTHCPECHRVYDARALYCYCDNATKVYGVPLVAINVTAAIEGNFTVTHT